MNEDRRRPTITANDAMRKAATERTPPPAAAKSMPATSLKSGTRVGEVYWCDFSHVNMIPEFDSEHLVVVVKSGKLADVSLVVPLTKRDQSGNPHGYKLLQNPNRKTADVSWAVCDHIYAVSAARLRQLRTETNQIRKPFALDDADLSEISRRVFRVLSPFLQKGAAQGPTVNRSG